jgi:hypothetical protein
LLDTHDVLIAECSLSESFIGEAPAAKPMDPEANALAAAAPAPLSRLCGTLGIGGLGPGIVHLLAAPR